MTSGKSLPIYTRFLLRIKIAMLETESADNMETQSNHQTLPRDIFNENTP